MYFSLYGLTVDAVIINRILPPSIDDSFFRKWKNTQQECILQAELYFTRVPIWKVNLFNDQVVGVEGLNKLGDQLYAEVDPMIIYQDETAYKFSKNGEQYQISLLLPFVQKGEILLAKRAEEVIIEIGGFRQHIPLPRSLTDRKPLTAKLVEDRLVIIFDDKPNNGDQ